MMHLLKISTMIKGFKFFNICLLFFLNTSVFSQNQTFKSTIKSSYSAKNITEKEVVEITKDFVSKKEYKQALNCITKHYKTYSKSLEINWLYAHILSLNNKKKEADKIFKKAISIAPQNIQLKRDYARFMFELGDIDSASNIMESFMDENSTNVEFLLMQAKISFWERDVKNAEKKINRILEIYPNTDITKNLENQISTLKATYLNVGFEYQMDSQPLKFFANHITAGEFISNFLNPQLEISRYSFSPQKEGALTLKLSNQFYFKKIKLTAKVSGGAYFNDSDNSDWIGELSFVKKIFKKANFNFGYTKNALLGTIASTSFNLTQQDLFGVLDYSNKYIILNLAYNFKFFEDNNNITSIGAWMVSQPIKFRKLEFQLGYGYGYTDAKDILFIYDNEGVGIYNPYFTPKQQEIHSALFISSYKPTKKITLQAKLNYGLQATVQNPYRIEVTPNQFETGGFYKADFNYTEINASIDYSISKNFGINANYVYQETFFYTRDNFNLGLNFIF